MKIPDHYLAGLCRLRQPAADRIEGHARGKGRRLKREAFAAILGIPHFDIFPIPCRDGCAVRAERNSAKAVSQLNRERFARRASIPDARRAIFAGSYQLLPIRAEMDVQYLPAMPG